MILWIGSLGRAQLDVSGLPHVCSWLPGQMGAAWSDGSVILQVFPYRPAGQAGLLEGKLSKTL